MGTLDWVGGPGTGTDWHGNAIPGKKSSGTTTSSPQPAPVQQKQLFTYHQALFGPNAGSFYGLVIPVSVGRRAIVGVPIFASPTYNGGANVDFAVSIGYGGAPASEVIDTQVLRIWANDTLIYDAFADAGWNVANKIHFKVYKGTEDQMPDPTLVKWLGAADGIAFRGQVYIMFNGYPVDMNAPAAIPVIRVEVRDSYLAAANVQDTIRLGNAAAYTNILLNATVDWYRKRVYQTNYTNNTVMCFDMFNRVEIFEFPTGTFFDLVGNLYCEPMYGYLIATTGSSNSSSINVIDPNSGATVGTFGTIGGSLANTSGNFSHPGFFQEFTSNGTSMTDAFIFSIAFVNHLPGITHLDPDGTISFVWCTGAGTTVHSDLGSLTTNLFTACAGDVVPFESAATLFAATQTEVTRWVVTPAGHGGWQVRNDLVWRPPANHHILHLFTTAPQDADFIAFTLDMTNSEQVYFRVRLNDNLRQKANPDPGTSGATGGYATTLWSSKPVLLLDSNAFSLGLDATFTENAIQGEIFDGFRLSQLGGTQTLGYPDTNAHKFAVLNAQDGSWFEFDFSDWTLDGVTVNTGAIPLHAFRIWDGDSESLIGWSAAGAASGGGFGPAKISPIVPPADGIPLYTILRWIMQYAGFDSSELSISTDLSDPFTGSLIEELDLNVWDVLDQMSKAFQFDIFESEGKVKMTRVSRGASLTISATLDPDNDLLSLNGSDDEGKGNNESGIDNAGQESSYAGFSTERDWNLDAPGTIEIRYIDEDQEYTVNIARAKKTTFPVRTTENNNVERLDTPVITTPYVMYQYAAKALYDLYAGIVFNDFRLGPKYLRLEPGDVVAIHINDMDYTIKVTEGTINYDWSMTCRGQGFCGNSDSLSTLSGEDALNNGGQTVAGPALSQTFIVDTPPLDPADCASITDSNLRIYAELTSYGQAGWPGAELLFSNASAGPYDSIYSDTLSGGSYVGVAATGISGALGYTTDLLTSMTVNFTVFPGAITGSSGYMLVGKPNRWEFMSYGSAVASTGNSRQYTFTNLVRGLRGTEWHTHDHAAGDKVLLYPNVEHLRTLVLGASLLSGTIWYKGKGINQDLSQVTPASFVESANFEKPWAPTSIKATTISGGSSGIQLSWLRRTRLEFSPPWGTGAPSQPLEPGWTEQYEIDILSGPSGAVIRTVTGITGASYTYASGNVTTDFGSRPSTLSLAVYQISPVVGRGFPGSVTIDVLSAT